jgi:tetratricopeptide (TPR) repeat protein
MATRIPDELLPVVEWWEKDGKQTVSIVAAVGIAVLAWYGFKNWRESRRIAAGDAVVLSEDVSALEEAVSSYGSSDAGAALKLRLAKSYYDASNYQGALDLYTELIGKAPAAFAEIPLLGKAESLEALERFADAVEAYDSFVSQYPESAFLLGAKIGAVRSLAQDGKKDEAQKRLAEIKESVKGDEAAVTRVEDAEDLVRRWRKISLFEKADAVSAAMKDLAAPDAPAAEAPAPAEVPPAPEAPAAEQSK